MVGADNGRSITVGRHSDGDCVGCLRCVLARFLSGGFDLCLASSKSLFDAELSRADPTTREREERDTVRLVLVRPRRSMSEASDSCDLLLMTGDDVCLSEEEIGNRLTRGGSGSDSESTII